MSRKILGKKILLLTAHPDDESFCAAGTIYENYKAGGKTLLICATLGEKGTTHLKGDFTPSQVKRMRKQELTAAAKFLRISKLFLLGLTDTRLKNCQPILLAKCLKLAKQSHPEAIVSFGEDGITGHLDHITVGRVAKGIATRLQVPFFAFILPPKLLNISQKWLKLKRRNGRYTESPLSFRKPDVKVTINSKIKQRVLRFHKSQMNPPNVFTGYPGYVVRELLRAEYFVYEPKPHRG